MSDSYASVGSFSDIVGLFESDKSLNANRLRSCIYLYFPSSKLADEKCGIEKALRDSIFTVR